MPSEREDQLCCRPGHADKEQAALFVRIDVADSVIFGVHLLPSSQGQYSVLATDDNYNRKLETLRRVEGEQ